MQIKFKDTEKNAGRQAALYAWIKDKKITYIRLGEVLDMSGAAASKALSKERIKTDYHKILLDFGIPASLLPRPENIKPGTKRKLST